MEIPQDMETMRSFLGLINYLNQFSPWLAELSDPLRQICREKEEFQLTEACEIAFRQCKEEISRNITLPYFKSPTILQTDASKKGLGAVLLQNSTPVMFASRALTGAKRNYQNLERECLAMIWGMEKFHYFWYGKEFTLETDQKPLVVIYKKHMVEISPRIQCLVVRSFPYQLFDAQYWRGTEVPLVDILSRVTPLPMEEDGIQLPIIAVNQITVNIPCSSNNLDKICEETRKDPTLKLLMHYISNGWPCEWRQLPWELQNYWNYQEDMSIEDRIATKGCRIPIPSTLQKKALQQIHKGHQGVEKCMLKARESVFCPGISDDICKAVERCGTCQSSSRAAKPIGNISEVAHPGHRSVLLEQDQLHRDWWLLYQIHHCEETSKQFPTCCDKGAGDGFHQIWMTIHAEKQQWTLLQFQGIPAVPWVL